jgi:hypothetical protein
MIYGPDGKPRVATDGPTGRQIVLVEHMVNGTPTWGIDLKGDMSRLYTIMIMTRIVSAVAQEGEAMFKEKQVVNAVKQKMANIDKVERENDE